MKLNISTKLSGCAFSLLLCTSAQAIEITTSTEDLDFLDAMDIVIPGVTVTEVFIDFGLFNGEFIGGESGGGLVDLAAPMGSSQIGIFENSSGTYGLPSSGGIVLSTGNVFDYEDGPNTSADNETIFGTTAVDEQNALLSPLTGVAQHFDPVGFGITFDASDDVDTFSFLAVFGSDEFPEYIGEDVNDGFGIFINGVNVAGARQTGAGPDDPLLPITIEHPDFMTLPGTELDGVLVPNGSPLLRFDVPIEPGSSGNVLEFLLADAGDAGVDSTVFLSSLNGFDPDSGLSEFTPILPDPNNPTNENGEFVFQLPEIIAGDTIWFDPDIATGYFYSTDGEFASVTAPSQATVPDPNGYQLTYNNGMSDVIVMLDPAEEYIFSVPVSEFTIDGIDTSLMLDPDDPLAFVTGVSFVESGEFFVTQAPITTFVDSTTVSEPPIFISFLLFSLLGLKYRRRNG